MVITKKQTIIGVVATGIAVLVFANSRPTKTTPVSSATNSASAANSVPAPELVIGDTAAKLAIYEYADFKCPQCNRFFHSAGAQIKQNFIDTGKVKIVYKNLAQISPDSKTAAQGAFCAAEQKKFSVYHDALYNYIWDNYYVKGKDGESAEVFSPDRVKQLAGQAGVDSAMFGQCLDSGKFENAVENDIAEAHQKNFFGTPSFIIGDQSIQGAQPYSVFKPLIESKLQ